MELTFQTIRYYFGLIGYFFGNKVFHELPCPKNCRVAYYYPDQCVGYCFEAYTFSIENFGYILGAILLSAAIAYLLGSLNFAVIISKVFHRDDVRNHGSKGAGATNMLRTYGKAAAALTFAGDLLKSMLAVSIGMILVGEIGAYLAMLFCVLGHAYPLYYKFKGGKGVATAASAILLLDPLVFAVLILVFVAIVALSKYISAGSIVVAGLYPLLFYTLYPLTRPIHLLESNFLGIPMRTLLFAIVFIVGIKVIYLHRANITRLFEGTENKLSFKKKV